MINLTQEQLIELLHIATGNVKDFVIDNEGWLKDHLPKKSVLLTDLCQDVSGSDFKSYLTWLNNQQKDYMGGEFMYSIKGHYKRLNSDEMFDYWTENVHSR